MTSAKLLLKRSIKSAASLARAGAGLSSPSAGAVHILAYHRVVADIETAEQNAYYGVVVSAPTFRRHCEILREKYDVVSFKTAADYLAGEYKPARPLAVITFDDGYLDFYEEAFPILSEMGLPSTVFVPIDLIGQEKPLAHDRLFWLLKCAEKRSVSLAGPLARAGIHEDLADYLINLGNRQKQVDAMIFMPNRVRERVIAELETTLGEFDAYPREYSLMNWAMAREMAAGGVEFGGHTANHVVLTVEDESSFADEIAASKTRLERQLDRQVIAFAYPNGAYNPGIRGAVIDAGYRIAVTTEKSLNRPGVDLLALGRTSLCEESTRGILGAYSPRVANLRLAR